MPAAPKKLIEVALPLEEINAACAREKSIRHGHPGTLHLWWAPRPLAAARAVIFGQMVDDPSGYVEELRKDTRALKHASRDLKERLKIWREKKRIHESQIKAGQNALDPGSEPTIDSMLVEQERERLFAIIRQLVIWENSINQGVLNQAREEIKKSWLRTCKREGLPQNSPLPAFHDPFAGGGGIPLEAQRLGLKSYASDLNPVAVLVTKAKIEIPSRFKGSPPINPESLRAKGATGWTGAAGLAEDIRRYGEWMNAETNRRIGHLYPTIEITNELAEDRADLKGLIGNRMTVIAWLWARTVKSPNPAASGKYVPITASFYLSMKENNTAYVEPYINEGEIDFKVRVGKPKNPEQVKAGTKTARGANFSCLLTGVPIGSDYVKAEGNAGRMGWKLMGIVVEGKGRVYLPPLKEHEILAFSAKPSWKPPGALSRHPQYMSCTNYGPKDVADLFMDRQTLALSTFGDVLDDLLDGNNGAPQELSKSNPEYKRAIATYLALGISRLANRQSTNTFWDKTSQKIQQVFSRHALPFIWDTAEGNPFSDSSGNFLGQLEYLAKALESLPANTVGEACQVDARDAEVSGRVVSTDPPYYDNVPYADLSDFFYVWQRRFLKRFYPDLFATILVPKFEELVADQQRHGGKTNAEGYFLDGMTTVMSRLASKSSSYFPTTIYYAFRQSENSEEGTVSTGWQTFIQAVIDAGYTIAGTWPMRTELVGNLKKNWNALASSIILVCRKREQAAATAPRREFVNALRRELPTALRDLQHGNLAPVDLPQSAIGPGMAIFTRYSKIVEADGSAMPVRSALQLINSAIDEFLSSQEAQMDDWTRFAVTWFSQNAYKQGSFGDAQNVATARNISVDGVRDAGLVESGHGKVRLYRPPELNPDWDPANDSRLTIWEIVHHLIRLLNEEGEAAAAKILSKIGGLAEDARSLCYRLYTICEQKKWADEGRDYNGLIVAWPELTRLASENVAPQPAAQTEFGLNT